MPLTFAEAEAMVSGLESRGWRLGLDRMAEFCRRANLEDAIGAEDGPQFIHVAGTNGKGSTTSFLQSLLIASGARTGAFFSPYVVDYRERIQMGVEMISPEEFAALTEELWPVSESLAETEFGGATKFEFETALGLLYWARHSCDWVALEVGLGGRLDATNVVHPRCAVITSIGLDHTAILGHTLPEIAFEKAGIIKPSIPTVIGELPAEAVEVIEQICHQRGSELWKLGTHIHLQEADGTYTVTTPKNTYSGLIPSLLGTKQPSNMALAVAAIDAAGIEISEDRVRQGVQSAVAPGRFQSMTWKGKRVLLDGAHNPEAAQVLRESIRVFSKTKRYHLVTNMLQGHEPADFYLALRDVIQSVTIAPLNMPRAYPVTTLYEALRAIFSKVEIVDSVEAGLELAARNCADEEEVLVTGSNYLVGDVINLLARTYIR